jgi:hypothetical protein
MASSANRNDEKNENEESDNHKDDHENAEEDTNSTVKEQRGNEQKSDARGRREARKCVQCTRPSPRP